MNQAAEMSRRIQAFEVIYLHNMHRVGFATRHRITVAQWDQRPDSLIEAPAYTYNVEADDMGMDPWREVDGTDRRLDGDSYDVWFASGYCRENAPADTPLYVSAQHYAMLTGAYVDSDGFAHFA